MRRWAWAAAAGLAAAGVAAALMPRALVGVFYDDGIYAALARSLAEGHGYRLLYLPGAPAAVHYPPLYPGFLAVLWRLWPAFPENVVVFRAANAVLLGLFAGGLAAYLARRRALAPAASAVLVLVGATAVPLLSVVTVLFAEPLFLALALGAWWLADEARETGGPRAIALAAGTGALAGLAGLTRSIGVAVGVGVVLALALARRRREALAAAAAGLLLLGPWVAWTAAAAQADWRRWALRALAVAGIAPVLAGFGGYQYAGLTKRWPTSTQRGISAAFEQIVPWVRRATPETAVLAGEDEALLWLYSGRRAVPSYLWRLRGRRDTSFGPDSLRAFFDRSGVSYVLVTGPRSDAAPTLDEMHGLFPGYLRAVASWPGPMIAYAIDRTPPPAAVAPS